MDLKCVTAASGGHYYVDHLPLLLGKESCDLFSTQTPLLSLCPLPGCQYPENLDAGITAGDSVMVFVDPDLFKAAQQDCGGWRDSMIKVAKL